MPFTGSHPAAVLLLTRCGLVPSAMVIGSMVPDAPYYLPTLVDADTTHSLTGTLTADLVLGGVLFVVWHGLLAQFAAAVAPAPVRARLDPAWTQRNGPVTVRGVALVALSLVIGAATHTLWDAFTHPGRWGTEHVGWLAAQQAGMPGYRWAQYASGVLGAAAIGVWLMRWWRTTPPTARPGAGRAVAGTAWALIVFAGVVGAMVATISGADAEWPLRIVFLAGTGAVGGGLVAAVLCAGWSAARRR
ncbi:DUF4184 family protein [Dactylosporangium fulvum]|uniref:DUF4184 family protein n=1 Tax=Dactylosporangium fulvum TaxID=53359 RepID=A0ABY5W746_9ACTN|nr:DUF4184 family protein [Dactylosporangium fulvum]UWP85347.1 DUF4184 family protein [Dactylosporangium fulvum]